MVLEVHAPTLSTASVDLTAAADRMTSTQAFMRGVALPADADLAAGLDAVKAAWGAALGVIVEDLLFLARQVAGGGQYVTTDHALADAADLDGSQPLLSA